ncbi:YHYH protein [Rubripirellula reticaptiva]|uniref:YHYH domain-containing protein n=1 Tax=Rubripirellula reticaptiva TaxID=2528013 RepID=A0A5C6EKE7_9BACT|nr:YHYH protein [Rubripirellula reticaptiva]TWU48091.1 hypothetical protein Poly59_49360 [Rubripirellula reticaptiva]
MKKSLCFAVPVVLGSFAYLVAQQPPPPRMHHVEQKGTLRPLPATELPSEPSQVTITIEGDDRVIVSNGIPNHKTGPFPNPGNPNRISVQRHEYRVPAKPKIADQISPMHGEFGVAVNGIPFDPGAGEFYDGEPGWQYEPLSGAIDLGIDVSHAHVQPTGKYHYHGLPTGLIDSIEVKAGSHSPIVGWAADGFPIYAVYGYSDPKNADSPIQKLVSSYQLKQGDRPGGNAPGGKYDGTFVRDYEYVKGSGDLDQCNGRFTITPEYPDGTYTYFMTEQWPVVPRNYRGTPSADFRHGPGSGGPGIGGPGFGDPMAGGPGGHGPGMGEHRGGPGRPGQMRPDVMHGGGMHPGGGPPRPGEIIPGFVMQSLNLTAQQEQQLRDLQATVDKELSNILTAEQQQRLQAPPPFGPGSGPGPGFGQRPGGGPSEDRRRSGRPQ